MAEKKERIPIPPEVATQVELAADRKCCVCRVPRLSIQIHHIDEDPSNNDPENLVVLCLQCHDDTQIRGGFGRKLNAHQVREFKRTWEAQVQLEKNSASKSLPLVAESGNEAAATQKSALTRLEHGVLQDDQGHLVIDEAPTVFFSDRMAFTFPGLDGLRIIDDSAGALYRLGRFLHHPIHFDEARGYGHSTDPIWWTRGPSNMYIERFEETDDGMALMDEQELKLKRIAAFNSTAYYQAFLYVEVDGMPPSGAYPHSPESMQHWMERRGYALEEYGYLNGRAFDLRFHDDGYIEIDGRVESVSGSKRRRRFLTAYNFLIVPKTSPLLDVERDDDVQKMLDDILHERSTPDVLAEYVEPTFKSRRDH